MVLKKLASLQPWNSKYHAGFHLGP